LNFEFASLKKKKKEFARIGQSRSKFDRIEMCFGKLNFEFAQVLTNSFLVFYL